MIRWNWLYKRTEYGPWHFGSSRQHISATTVLCGLWTCISIVDSNKSVPQFLGVWSWPLTLRGHLISKHFSIRKPIHDFLSNFYRHFLSISYRFWNIWLRSIHGLTLTFNGHLGSEIFWPFESLYLISYLTSIDTFLYFVPFLRYSTSKLTGFDLDLQRSPEVQNMFIIWKPVHDFRSNFNWHFLSILYHTVLRYCF